MPGHKGQTSGDRQTGGRCRHESERMSSLMTPLGLVEGEILDWVDRHGPTALHKLTQELDWSPNLILMGIGALVRQDLAWAVQVKSDIIVRSREEGQSVVFQVKARSGV
jgi:hypothetical protein